MRRNIWSLVLCLTLIFALTASVNAIYFPDEITVDMVEEWAEETEQYREDSALDVSYSNHAVSEIMGEGALMRLVRFHTVARQIMEEAHQAYRQYKEPDIDQLKQIIGQESDLKVIQLVMVEERGDRDPDDMHLVLKIQNDDNEEIIQPKSVVEQDSGYHSGNHAGIKGYLFDYNDLPSRQEYENNEYNITLIFISNSGEVELEVPWMEIR